VAGAREFAEAGFQGVFVEWMALAQGNTAAHETIIEFVQPLEFDAVDNIRKRIAEIEFEANGMLHRIENWIGIYRLWGGRGFGIAPPKAPGIEAAQLVHFFLREGMSLLDHRKKKRLA